MTTHVPCYVAPVDGSPSATIVAAVVTHSGSTPLDVDPLQRYVDMEALDALVTSDAPISIEFEYAGYQVVVDAARVRLYD